jgi:hypothetical protein
MFQRNVPLSLSTVEKSQEREIDNPAPQHKNSDLNPQYDSYVFMAFQQHKIYVKLHLLGFSCVTLI